MESVLVLWDPDSVEVQAWPVNPATPALWKPGLQMTDALNHDSTHNLTLSEKNRLSWVFDDSLGIIISVFSIKT